MGAGNTSLLLSAGVHLKVASKRRGHASVAFNLVNYSHVMPGLQEAAAVRSDKILNPAGHSQIRDIESVQSFPQAS